MTMKTVKRQKQATWLYVFFLFLSFYILFYITMKETQSKVITVTQITPEIFNKLRLKHASTLSCPCSTITIPYKIFINSTVTFHSVCSSLFVSEQWIEALYLANSSLYAVSDFRTIARSQFRILARLCSLSKTIIEQNQNDLDYNELVTKNLLSEEQIQAEINASAEFLKNSLSSQIIAFLNYFRTMVHANYFISALNTNAVVERPVTVSSLIASAYRTACRLTDISMGQSSISVCSIENPISSVRFFSSSYDTGYIFRPAWQYDLPTNEYVKGFFTSCTPLEGLLVSTLDCLYDFNCLQIWFNYFPALNQFKSNLTNSILLSTYSNLSVYDHFVKFFIEEYSVNINYSIYFQECAPSVCTYVTTNRNNFVTALALLISLYGGLTIILRLIASILISLTAKLNNYSFDINNFNLKRYLREYIQQLNLFARDDRDETVDIRQQMIITRIYLILLPISFVILLLFASLETEIITVEVSNPSYEIYQNLRSNTPECPCSKITIAYREFIELIPIFHQICSSSFISQSWLTILNSIANQKVSTDWLNQIPSHFQLLSNLCQLANQTINDAIDQVMKESFISSNLLTESDIHDQMNIIFNEFSQSTILHFSLVVDILHLLTQVDQPYMGIIGTSLSSFQTNIEGRLVTNLITGQQSVQFNFFLEGTRNINTTLVECICAINPYCQSSVAIYDVTYKTLLTYSFNVSYIVPGFMRGCSAMDSLLYSTLECFYQDSECFSIVINYIKIIYFQTVEFPLWLDIRSLVYDPLLTSYLPNTTIDTLVKQLMIEKWNQSILYKDYYQTCAPIYCTYTKTARSRMIIDVITLFISMLGGLIISLRLLIPLLVKLVNFIFKKMRKSSQEQTDMDRIKAKQLGRWSTRLFICLYIIGIIILALYTIVQPRIVTKTFSKSSYNTYLQLKQQYNNRLECTCSSISSNYAKFVRIEPIFHPICSSSIVTDEWRVNLTAQLIANLSIYDEKDYRRFVSAHLQLLTGLCQLSINDTIHRFLSSVFITNQLVAKNDFHLRLNSSISQTISAAPITLTRLFYIIQDMNDYNAIMSNYGTNLKHIIPIYESTRLFAQTQGKIYDDQCACDRTFQCTSSAYFMSNNTSNLIRIKGLKIGCTPTESFRASTLECFFDSLCLQLIQNYTQAKSISIPSLPVPIRFFMNTTIGELINELFVDEWSIDANYSLYFQYCSLQFCSYAYVQQLNILYIITLMLGLQGGLTIVLKWICPKFVQFICKINEYQTRRNLIRPIYPIDISPFPSDSSTTSDNSTSYDIELITTNIAIVKPITSPVQYSTKIISIVISLLIIMTTILVIFSVYFAKQEQHEPMLNSTHTISSTTVVFTDIQTSTTSTTTSSSITVMNCQIKFQSIIAYKSQFQVFADSPVIADFNNDKRLDIAFYQITQGTITILFQNANNTFPLSSVISVDCESSLNSLAVSDFNNDSLLDLVGICSASNYMYILLANENGTFKRPLIYSIENESYPSDITIADFNNDSIWDIAVILSLSKRVSIFFGYGNGTFSKPLILSTGRNSFPRAITVADFNNDGYQDIGVVNTFNKNIGIFLNYNSGLFQEQKTFFTGGGSPPYNFAIGDFNNDNIMDIVCAYQSKISISILFGYENGNLSEISKILIQLNLTFVIPSITVADINLDDYPDILIGIGIPYTIYALIANGKGNFQQQTIFTSTSTVYQVDITTGDLNGDGYPDIVAATYQGFTVNVFYNTGQCLFSTNP